VDTGIYPMEFLYDGNCPICLCDVANLRRRDKHRRLRFIDVTASNFADGACQVPRAVRGDQS